jgi:rubrerythrin
MNGEVIQGLTNIKIPDENMATSGAVHEMENDFKCSTCGVSVLDPGNCSVCAEPRRPGRPSY